MKTPTEKLFKWHEPAARRDGAIPGRFWKCSVRFTDSGGSRAPCAPEAPSWCLVSFTRDRILQIHHIGVRKWNRSLVTRNSLNFLVYIQIGAIQKELLKSRVWWSWSIPVIKACPLGLALCRGWLVEWAPGLRPFRVLQNIPESGVSQKLWRSLPEAFLNNHPEMLLRNQGGYGIYGIRS